MPDPYLEIGAGVGGRSLPKTFFRPFGPQFGSKIRGGPFLAHPLDPPLEIHDSR